MKQIIRVFLLVAVIFSFAGTGNDYLPFVPVTGANHPNVLFYVDNLSTTEIGDFTREVWNGNQYSLAGLYAENSLAFPVFQQPSNQAGYVSTKKDVVTQFSIASNYGSIGIVAHNYLAGSKFFELKVGQVLTLVYGDGHHEDYTITETREYQALSPNSPYSSFVNLSVPDKRISYEDLFYETYGVSDHLILQTCIQKGSVDSWGRLFIIAEKSS